MELWQRLSFGPWLTILGLIFFLFDVHTCVPFGKMGPDSHLAERLQLLKGEGCSSIVTETTVHVLQKLI